VATWDDGAHALAVGDAGEVYERISTDFQKITTPAPAIALSDVEVLFDDPDLDVIITGTGGFVMMRAPGSPPTWTTPKSQTIDPLVRASFQSPTHGFIIGNQFLICEYE
jgi:photosystem II stability/assembly factor-like uncharacterized protein